MRHIAIIGAGQAGLTLSIVLKQLGYRVTLYSNRTADQIRKGKMLTTAAMFDRGLQFEQKWGLNYWDRDCIWANAATVSLGVPGESILGLQFKGKILRPFQSIDQRMKFSHLLDVYEQTGGKLVVQDVGVKDLNDIAKDNELTIVAGGKGEISQLFSRDSERSMFDKPMRALATFIVNGMVPEESNPSVRVSLLPGIGEYFSMPTLSGKGRCATMLFEGIPGGPFDCFNGIKDPQEQLEVGRKLLKQFVPWEAERCEKIELLDEQSSMVGRYAPTVRDPVAKTPSGKHILGLADTVVLNDPIAGQGANNAGKAADIYLQSIIEHGKRPFDEAWMRNTFEKFWDGSAQPSTMFSNMLLMPPPPHIIEFLQAGAKNPLVADKLAQGFENPASLFPWILTPEDTKSMIHTLEIKRTAGAFDKEMPNIPLL